MNRVVCCVTVFDNRNQTSSEAHYENNPYPNFLVSAYWPLCSVVVIHNSRLWSVLHRTRNPTKRPEPNRAYNPQDEVRLDERAYELDEFSEDSYYAGYDDGFSDLEIYYRDYDRYQPVSSRNEYSLGYSDGYHDASWSY